MGGRASEIRQEVERTETPAVPLTIPEVIDLYLAGESIQVLQKLCGANTRRQVYRWMLSELGDEKYRDLVTQCLVARVADADEALELATDPVQISKWRETARFARLDLERRRPALYGPKQEVKHSGVVPTLNIILLSGPSEGGQMIDVTPVAAPEMLPGVSSTKEGERDGVR